MMHDWDERDTPQLPADMPWRAAWIALLSIVLALLAAIYVQGAEVYFSPNGGAEQAICDRIAAAQDEILVGCYSFTSQPIADALIAAKKRGVDVCVVADRSQPHARNSMVYALAKAKIPVYIDSKHPIHHNKFLVYDRKSVGTGSFNLTPHAQHNNAENHVILDDADLAKQYAENWQHHQKHSERLK